MNRMECLNCFNLVPFNPHRQRALNRINRDHESLATVSCDQYAFKTLERSTADTNSLPNLEKRMRRPGNVAVDQGSDGINLLPRDWRAFTPAADEPKYSTHAQYIQAFGALWQKLRENIATKQRQFHLLLPVAPAVHFCHEWQIGLYTPICKALHNQFLVPRPRVEGIPAFSF